MAYHSLIWLWLGLLIIIFSFPIGIGENSAMNQSEFLAITCNLLKARENSSIQGAIGSAFASYWMKNWREIFRPIAKRRNRNHVITFDSHLKTALIPV